MKAWYRKMNDGSHSSSTYHKKDGTNVRAKFKLYLLKGLFWIFNNLAPSGALLFGEIKKHVKIVKY